MSKSINFTCPKCGCDYLEQVTRNVTETAEVNNDLFDDDEIQLGETETFLECGKVSFECADGSCEFVVPGASNSYQLLSWLSGQGMIEEDDDE